MTAADQTPAQLPRVGEGGSTVGDGETPARPTTHVHECACNRNWGGPCGQCVCESDVRLGVGPAPDGNAGGADDEVYLTAAQAMLAHQFGDEERTLEWRHCGGCVHKPNASCVCPDEPYPSVAVRAAIDAARAPLVAELAEAIRERDEAREEAAGLREYVKAVHDELAEAKAGRDEARAKTDGGKWGVEYGVIRDGGFSVVFGQPLDRLRALVAHNGHELHERDVWQSAPRPVKPVTDGGSAP